MQHIELLQSNANEDVAAMSIAFNKNMKVIQEKLNELLDQTSESASTTIFSLLDVFASQTEAEDDNFKVVRTIAAGIATFTITPKFDDADMRQSIVSIYDFSNESILCPKTITEQAVTFKIDNIDDIAVTNQINPANDVNNKKFIIVYLSKN